MNTTINKKPYQMPTLARIAIDNEMCLILVSPDPGDPDGLNDDYYSPGTEYYNQQPL